MPLRRAIEVTLNGGLPLVLAKGEPSRQLTLVFCVPQFIGLILIGNLILCVNAPLDVGYGNLETQRIFH